MGIRKINMRGNEGIDLILSKKFERIYQGFLSSATLDKYISIMNRIEKGTMRVLSKSVYLQTKSVLDKCKKANISVSFFLPEWKKRSDMSIKKHRIDKYVSYQDLKRIIKNLPNTRKGRELKLVIEIAYYSGARLSEVLNLKKRDIYIKKGSPIRLEILGKNEKYRISYLPRSMEVDLKDFKKFDLNLNYAEVTFKRSLKKIPNINLGISFHSLRHSCAKNWLRKGLKLNKIQQLLGHENLTTTSIYLKCLDEDHKELVSIGY